MRALPLVFVFVSLVGFSHDFNLARFDIKVENDQPLLVVRLDRENLLEAVQPECLDKRDLDRYFEEYMKQHFAIEINDQKVTYRILSHNIEEQMIELHFQVDHQLNQVKKIGIYNDTLLELFNEQENIVSSFINGKRRSFRMHKDRIRIMIEY